MRYSRGRLAGVGLAVLGLVAAACNKGKPPPVRTKIVCPSASVSASASAAPAKKTLAQRAAEGDPAAIKKLEGRARTDRTSVQTLALASATAVAKRKDLHELQHKIKLVPKLAKDPATRKRIWGYVKDDQVADDALGMVAGLPGPTGPDMLYGLWTRLHGKGETGKLAGDLLYSKDVHGKASPALQALLDLRAADQCKDVASILKQLTANGDRRAVGSILKLKLKVGCGPKKTEDCWKCLRGTSLIKDALKAVSKHRAP